MALLLRNQDKASLYGIAEREEKQPQGNIADRVWESLGPFFRGAGRAGEETGAFIVGSMLRGASFVPGLESFGDRADNLNRVMDMKRAYDQHLDQTGAFADVFGSTAANLTGVLGETASDMVTLGAAGKAAGIKTPKGFTNFFAATYGAKDAENALTTGKDAGLSGTPLYSYALLQGGSTAAATKMFGAIGDKIGVGTAEELMSRSARSALGRLFTRKGLSDTLISAALEGGEEETQALLGALWNQAYDVDDFQSYTNHIGEAFLAGAITSGVFSASSQAFDKYSRTLDKLPQVVAGSSVGGSLASRAIADTKTAKAKRESADSYSVSQFDPPPSAPESELSVAEQKELQNLFGPAEEAPDVDLSKAPEEFRTAFEQLSDAEKFAVRDYVSTGYKDINKVLRGDAGSVSSDPENIAHITDKAATLESALQKLPPFQGDLYRRLKFSGPVPDDVKAQLSEGKTFVDPAFVSSSTSVRYGNVLAAEGETNVTFQIEGKSARDVTPLNPHEAEAIFPPNTAFEVVSSKELEGGHLQVKLREVGPQKATDAVRQTLASEQGKRNAVQEADVPDTIKEYVSASETLDEDFDAELSGRAEELAGAYDAAAEAGDNPADQQKALDDYYAAREQEYTEQQSSVLARAVVREMNGLRSSLGLDTLLPLDRLALELPVQQAIKLRLPDQALEIAAQARETGDYKFDMPTLAGLTIGANRTARNLKAAQEAIKTTDPAQTGMMNDLIARETDLRRQVDLITSAIDRSQREAGQRFRFSQVALANLDDPTVLVMKAQRGKSGAQGGLKQLQSLESSQKTIDTAIRETEREWKTVKGDQLVDEADTLVDEVRDLESRRVEEEEEVEDVSVIGPLANRLRYLNDELIEAEGVDLNEFVKVVADIEARREVVVGPQLEEVDRSLEELAETMGDSITEVQEQAAKKAQVEEDEGGVAVVRRDIESQIDSVVRSGLSKVRSIQRQYAPEGETALRAQLNPVVKDFQTAIGVELEKLRRQLRDRNLPEGLAQPVAENADRVQQLIDERSNLAIQQLSAFEIDGLHAKLEEAGIPLDKFTSLVAKAEKQRVRELKTARDRSATLRNSIDEKVSAFVKQAREVADRFERKREIERGAGGAEPSAPPTLDAQLNRVLRQGISDLRSAYRKQAGLESRTQEIDPVVRRIREEVRAAIEKVKTDDNLTVQPKEKPTKVDQALEKRLRDQRRTREAVEAAIAGHDLNPEERNAILEAHERLKAADETLQQLDPGSPEYDEAALARQKANIELQHAVHSTSLSRWRQTAGEANALWHTMKLALDASYVGIHGGVGGILMRPTAVITNFGRAMRAFDSEVAAFKQERALFERPNADLYMAHYVTMLTEDMPLTAIESGVGGRFADSLPVFKDFNRAFRTFLSGLRADLFDWRIEVEGGRANLSDHNLQQIGRAVDTFTGRGGRGSFIDRHADILRYFALAPRMYASQIEILSGAPIWTSKDTATRKMVANMYGKVLGNIVNIYGMAAIANLFAESAGEEDAIQFDFDPTSPYFANVKIGDNYYDPTFRLARWVAFMGSTAHLALSSFTDDRRGVTRLYSNGVRLRRTNSSLQDRERERRRWWSFLRGKSSLAGGAITDIVQGRHITGEKVTPWSLIRQHAMPITVNELMDNVKEQGIPSGVAKGMLDLLAFPVREDYSKR